jgi:hypothetical protein
VQTLVLQTKQNKKIKPSQTNRQKPPNKKKQKAPKTNQTKLNQTWRAGIPGLEFQYHLFQP